jgi:hypothetical protein
MKEVRIMSEFLKRINPGYIIALGSLSCTIGVAIPAILLLFSRL